MGQTCATKKVFLKQNQIYETKKNFVPFLKSKNIQII